MVQAEENRRRGSTSNAVGMNILKVGLQVHFEVKVRLGCLMSVGQNEIPKTRNQK